MKTTLTLFVFSLFSIGLWFQMPDNTTTSVGMLEGSVESKSTGEKLLFANIVISRNGVTITGTNTDVSGSYRLELPAGQYDVKCTYVGFEDGFEEKVIISEGETTLVNFSLDVAEGISGCEVLVKSKKKTSAKRSKKKAAPLTSSSSKTISSKEIRDLPTRNINALVATTAGLSSSDEGSDITVRGSRLDATNFYLDGIRVLGTLPSEDLNAPSTAAGTSATEPSEKVDYYKESPEERFMRGEILIEDALEIDIEAHETIEEYEEDSDPEAGQLTAGEWDGLKNWDFWQDAEKNPEKIRIENRWAINLNDRYTLRITNSDYQPVVDCPVYLMNKKGDTLWRARTDYEGKAELWANIFTEKDQKLEILATYNNETKRLKFLQKSNEGINHLLFPAICQPSNALDIAFVVDATGSMADELAYLKAEVRNVIQRVQEENNALDIQLGAHFYRDHTDAYLTKARQLTKNIASIESFIKKQHAGGGGDYPEAVAEALAEAVNQPWRSSARARILFLVLDAPPHFTPQTIQSIQNSVAKAAAKGIKIIPIAGSGIEKETEYLMKSFAIATGGTYVFLTDDSGIGNPHIEVTAEDFEVEFLNDLMVKLINRYTREMCEAEDRWNPENPNDPQQYNDLSFHPNPAGDHIMLTLADNADQLVITTASGQLVKEYGFWQKGTSRLNVGDLSAGVYFIQCVVGDKTISQQLIIIQS